MTITTTAPAPADSDDRRKKAAWRPLAAAAATGSVLLIAGFGVFAQLNAQATGVQSVNSGTLKLSLADTGTVGFAQQVSNMAPGDKVNRFVTLTNSGSLASKTLTMKVGATGTSSLITDGTTTQALRVTVANCSAAWSGLTCSGTETPLLSNVVLSALSSANAFNAITTANSGDVLNLKVTVALPDQDETTVNGNLPANTVQNGNVSLNYTFAEVQRAGTTT